MWSPERLKKARKAVGKKQQEVADELGIHVITLSRYENGDREPKTSDLQRLAQILNTTVAYLTGEEDSTMSDIAKLSEKHKIVEVEVINVPIVAPKITACAGEGNGYYGVEWNIVAMRPIPTSQLIGHLWQGVKLRIITIEGFSMEPKYRSGDKVLFAEGEEIKSSDVVVAIWDDRLYIRSYFTEGDDVILKPRNPVAGEIRVDKDDPRLQVLGKVIARVPDVEMEGGFYS